MQFNIPMTSSTIDYIFFSLLRKIDYTFWRNKKTPCYLFIQYIIVLVYQSILLPLYYNNNNNND